MKNLYRTITSTIRFDVQPKNVIRFDSIDVPTGQRCADITQHACHGERRQLRTAIASRLASNYVAHLTRLDRHTYMKPNYAVRLIRSKHTP